MTRFGPEIRTIPELMWCVAHGWRYEHCEPHERSQRTNWHQYWLIEPDGLIRPVQAGIAVAAWRRGLAKPARMAEETA